jgi:hypothetical protein
MINLEGHGGKREWSILRYRMKGLRKATVWKVASEPRLEPETSRIHCRSAYTRPQQLII